MTFCVTSCTQIAWICINTLTETHFGVLIKVKYRLFLYQLSSYLPRLVYHLQSFTPDLSFCFLFSRCYRKLQHDLLQGFAVFHSYSCPRFLLRRAFPPPPTNVYFIRVHGTELNSNSATTRDKSLSRLNANGRVQP